jgi:MFS family permease
MSGDVFRIVMRRIMPVLFLSYVVSFLDRVNIGFAKLQMSAELGYSDVVYGFGAGIFFIGYFLFEVPSNLMLERFGARVWIARIMITWGIISGAFAFVDVIPWGPLPELFGLPHHEFSLYALRFLLGLAEAGFFPGIILYLTYWFPREMHARTIATFMTAIAVSSIIGAPLSGALLEGLHGAQGWHGWRWLFVIEAVPSVIMGIVIWRVLPNGPRDAKWLTDDQRTEILNGVARSHAESHHVSTHSIRSAFANPRLWFISLTNLTGIIVLYAVSFWMPTIVHEMGVDRGDYFTTGLLTMIPWVFGGISMVLVARHSDRTGERRWHLVGCFVASVVGLLLLTQMRGNPVGSILALTIITCGSISYAGPLWSLPPLFLRGSAAAAGIALINSVTNLGGHIGPDLLGRMRSSTWGEQGAFTVLAIIGVVGIGFIILATRGIAHFTMTPQDQ